MKRLFIITTVVLVLALGAVTAWRLWPAAPPSDSLYGHYSQRDDVRVGFLHDYMLDDSVAVDVVTVEAHDSTGWSWMQTEFDIPHDGHRLEVWTDSAGRYLFCMPQRQSLCIVEAADERQMQALIRHHLQLIKQ